MRFLYAMAMIAAMPAQADILVPVRTIRAKEIISPSDITAKPVDVTGALVDPALVVGQEARAVLYAGRPIRPGDVGPPAIISRNDLVTLIYLQGGLQIVTEGRALGRGASGEVIRAMNSASRTTVSGRIRPDGSIEVR